jgi:hypothetical protein
VRRVVGTKRIINNAAPQTGVVHEDECKMKSLSTTSADPTALHGAFARGTLTPLDSNHFFPGMEERIMRKVKQASKRKRLAKSVPVLGAAGLTFSLVGGASAGVAPTTDAAKAPIAGLGHEFTLGEEEIADVSLATFYVFDKENAAAAKNGVQEARGCGRGCGRGCRGCGRGCRGCGGCGGCGGGCCLSWGACRIC